MEINGRKEYMWQVWVLCKEFWCAHEYLCAHKSDFFMISCMTFKIDAKIDISQLASPNSNQFDFLVR